jgi:hypothetical protein
MRGGVPLAFLDHVSHEGQGAGEIGGRGGPAQKRYIGFGQIPYSPLC